MPAESYSVFNKASGAELEVDASFQPLLHALDGKYSASEVVDQYVESTRSSDFQSPLTSFTDGAMKEGANQLLLGLRQQGFVVERPA